MKKKRPPGRPKHPDKKVHLPRVKIRGSLLEKLIRESEKSNQYLSHIIEKACQIYINMHKNEK